ncbi:hypothetical protein [Ferribacterium limneticum]|uniref:hypothetical protein n=1 Tax=Ferribacterium limneticum TaxID=76259 RepID=UPI001CFBA40E|nr:hypothetical protein [Ferribacterium limneticum]UCV20035.1 hypothetical protein KI610_05525 [Ferribacterium limneticum]
MNLWKKLGLSTYSTTPCRACGTSLGVEKAGTGWFIWGWLPFSLSGLFPFPAKIILGCLGIGLIFAPHLFFIPLVQKTSEIKRTPPRGMMLWLSIVFLSMFASDWINLLPSTQTKIIALLVSVVLTFPVIKTVWDRIPKADEKILAFGAGYLLILGMHYFALSTVPPALVSRIWGEQSIANATVDRKRHSNKLTRCANKVDIIFTDDDAKHEICLSEESWKQITKGSTVTVKIQESSYGRLVTAVEPLVIDSGLTK